jgi:hypothetical protein
LLLRNALSSRLNDAIIKPDGGPSKRTRAQPAWSSTKLPPPEQAPLTEKPFFPPKPKKTGLDFLSLIEDSKKMAAADARLNSQLLPVPSALIPNSSPLTSLDSKSSHEDFFDAEDIRDEESEDEFTIWDDIAEDAVMDSRRMPASHGMDDGQWEHCPSLKYNLIFK